MFFTFSKIFWLLVKPLNFLGFLMALALAFRLVGLKKTVNYTASLAVLFFLFFGILPLGTYALYYLENQYSKIYPVDLAGQEEAQNDIDGIILLGGMLDVERSAYHKKPIYNRNANRLLEFIALHRQYPDAKAVITGGPGGLFNHDAKPSNYIKQTLESLGVDPRKINFEINSRNTFENAIYSKQKINPSEGEKWILVTSAYHMPRAVSVFCGAGWPVIPYPVGHIVTQDQISLLRVPDILAEFQHLDIALKEGIGIIAYRAFNKSSHSFAPEPSRTKSNASVIQCY